MHEKYRTLSPSPLIDLRGQLPTVGKYVARTRQLTDLAIHHSLTKTGSSEVFARYHTETLGWPGIGYTYVIRKTGEVDWCHDRDLKTYHVGRHNGYSLGICLIGDFRTEDPTPQQIVSLSALLSDLVVSIPTVRVISGHSDFPGYEWKACPVFSVESVLRESGLEQYIRQ